MIGIAALVLVVAAAQMPPGMTHEEHRKQMEKEAALKKRGAAAMGFDQDAAAHRFQIDRDGGRIEVEARAAADTKTRDAIRAHLRQVAVEFSQGVFDKPLATHAETPDGVPALVRLKADVSYTFEELSGGGRVRIRTSNAEALAAVHAFLEYQKREHHTPR